MNLAEGNRLGPYEVLSRLGAGGMGEVWLARDTRLNREVAIKLIPDGIGGPEFIERFRREARAASALNHPHICVVHDIGEHGGRPYLVMERMKGQTLKDLIGGKAIPTARLAELGAQIADALDAAHEAGIVHRDIKSANIFVTERGGAKLLDFGLAKVGASSSGSAGSELETAEAEQHLTNPGSTLGTVAYMSPEQARGEALGGRSDLFSFGVVLYEMSTGRLPFAGRTSAEIFDGILNRAPIAPTALNSALPAEMERIILKALEKEGTLRYQHASELTADLRRLLRDSTSGRASAVTSGPVPHQGRSRRIVVGGWFTAVILFSVAAGWFVRRAGVPRPMTSAPTTRRIVVLPFENVGAPEDSYFADGMTDEVRSKLSRLSGLTVIAGTSSGRYRATTKPAEQIAKELGVRYLLVAKLRWQKSHKASVFRVTPELVEVAEGSVPTTRWQETFDGDLTDVFKVQGDIAEKVAHSLDIVLSGKEHAELSERPTSNLAAYDAYLRGMGEMGTASWRTALADFEKAVALDPGFGLAWAQKSLVHSLLYRFVYPSPQEAEAARRSAERALELAPHLPRSVSAMAHYEAFVANDLVRGKEALERALTASPNDVELLLSLSELESDTERKLGILHRAETVEPQSEKVLIALANVLTDLRRPAEARAACDRGLAAFPASLRLIFAKSFSHVQEGDLGRARATIAAAPKGVEPTSLVAYFGDVRDLDWVLDNTRQDLLLRLTPAAFRDDRAAWAIVLAQASSRRSDLSNVRSYAEEARTSLESLLSRDPENAGRRVFLGLSLAYLGRKEEAMREGERAIGQAPTPYNRHQLARIYILCGDHGKALDLLEPLLKEVYFLTPGWLRIDPNFDPLRGNSRFEELSRGK